MSTGKTQWAVWCLRITLSSAFLSAVADRFGLWGPPGSADVAWGDLGDFLQYAGRVNSFAPRVLIPLLAWTATIAELVLGLWLLVGIGLRWAAYSSAALLLAFALAMTISFGVKSPLDYSAYHGRRGGAGLGCFI